MKLLEIYMNKDFYISTEKGVECVIQSAAPQYIFQIIRTTDAAKFRALMEDSTQLCLQVHPDHNIAIRTAGNKIYIAMTAANVELIYQELQTVKKQAAEWLCEYYGLDKK